MKKQLDSRGIACPGPVISIKKELDANFEGVLEVVVDNSAARENVKRFVTSQGGVVDSVNEENGVITLMARVGDCDAETIETDDAKNSETIPSSEDTEGVSYIIGTASMGGGDEKLGVMLLTGFINNLPNVSPLPQSVFFYNGGVTYTSEGAETLETLITLEKKGVEIFTCGTCTEYHGITDKVRVGQLGNIYDLTMIMQRNKVITL